jgi:cytochrome c nitrite reductase small subunit
MSRPNRLISFFTPPPQWRVPVIILMGMLAGLAFYLLRISNATSYLSDVPHDSFIRKYYFKASDGLRHATIFTLRKEPQSIYIREPGKRVVQENCLRCHESLFSDGPGRPLEAMAGMQVRHCLDCHRNTPHDRVNSISSTQFAITPTLKDNL